MGISKKIIEEIKLDCELQNYKELLLEPFEYKSFFIWFEKNARECFVNQDVKINSDGYDYPLRNCFGNSQSVALRTNKLYVEGFHRVMNIYQLHGFNYHKGLVEDYTAYFNKNSFLDYQDPLYVGVIIPKYYIRKKRDKSIVNNYQNINPLIFDYFKSQVIELK